MDITHASDVADPSYAQLAPSTTFQFPTSSARHDVAPPKSSTSPAQRYDPLGIFKQAEDTARRAAALAASTTYRTDVPRPCRIGPGVLSDGSITIGHPEINCFLQSAEVDPRVEPPTSPAIFALAALAVFYHPNRPAHWIFWAKDKRESTASIVQKVIDAQPVLITSPISWIGIPESLWVLGNLQYGWRGELAKTAWYGCFVDAGAPAGRMNLRKRKALQTEGVGDTVAPAPRKRPRTRRIGSSVPTKEPCAEDKKEKTPVLPVASSGSSTALLQPTLIPNVEVSDSQSVVSGGQKRTSLRQKARRAKTAQVPPSAQPCHGRMRDRSPSSGCSTAVSNGRGRSSSSVSGTPSEAATVVEDDCNIRCTRSSTRKK